MTATVEREVELARLNADLDQRVQARTAELEATIGELEAFSYSVSHDLRAPVRTISALAEALGDAGPARDSVEARDLVRRIHAAAIRMDGLIEVLLELCAAARAEPHREALDLSTLARDELQRLAERDQARAVHSIVQPNMTALGDERLIAIVLHNLLTNAWKFTSGSATPTIEVGTLRPKGRASDRVHFVRDNGIGFDMQRVDDLFLPFRRLHSIRDFDGIGVGLAIVHRIVTRHAGRVWAESTPGSGATFFFTLPEVT
ncbi:MAG: ATP-binding protein [Chloroflexi bacterium]|nr:ATP-binding protein [Chloroflexota bacterium]